MNEFMIKYYLVKAIILDFSFFKALKNSIDLSIQESFMIFPDAKNFFNLSSLLACLKLKQSTAGAFSLVERMSSSGTLLHDNFCEIS